MSSNPTASIVIPTYQERGNIETLAERLGAMAAESGIEIEVMLMDDQSRDGSIEAVEALALPWFKLVERTGERGLSPAVLDGMHLYLDRYWQYQNRLMKQVTDRPPEP